MNRSRLIVGQLAGFTFAILAALVYASAELAASLGYHPLLGEPLLTVGNTLIYGPWVWITAALSYYEHVPKPFQDTQIYLMAGVLFGTGWAVGLKKAFASNEESTAHGSARWTTQAELNATGMVQKGSKHPDGVVIGAQEDGSLLIHDGKEHIFCFAPTRSGKGVGLVIPTLLTWCGSVLVLDVKGENWNLTSGWRSKFSHTLYFNPTDENSVRFNPLLEIRKGPGEVRDVQNVVEILCDPDGTANSSDFWTASAKSLLTGLILHVLYAEDDKSLAGVLSFIRAPGRESQEAIFDAMLATKHLGDRCHPIVAQSAQSMKSAAEKTRSGIIVTAERFLTMFEDPILADVTRTSDFRLRDLQYSKYPCSLYLVVPPSDMIRLRPLLRLMLNQLGSTLTESLDVQDDHHKLLLLLDEFPVLGRLDWFENALAYIAGYDIKAYLIAQDLNQIEKAYGQNNAILGNTHVRIAFAANDDRTAKRISDLLGQATRKKKSESKSGGGSVFGSKGKSVSEVEFQRALMTPGEVLQLDPDRQIVMLAGQPPILSHKVRYYEDARFKSRCPGIIRDRSKAISDGWAADLKPPKLFPGRYPDLPKSSPSPWEMAPSEKPRRAQVPQGWDPAATAARAEEAHECDLPPGSVSNADTELDTSTLDREPEFDESTLPLPGSTEVGPDEGFELSFAPSESDTAPAHTEPPDLLAQLDPTAEPKIQTAPPPTHESPVESLGGDLI